ncbi:hypothetical protein VTO42DRAFT_8045 [Malbranchea cinnamomea]
MEGASNRERHSDIVIVGSGIFGLSTAVHLAKSTSKNDRLNVILLDVRPYHPSPHTGGASNDVNKIVRADYDDPFYMELAYEALDAWNSDPEFVDRGVFHRTGWVLFDKKVGGEEKDQPSTPPRNTPIICSSVRSGNRIRENFRKSSRPDQTVSVTANDLKHKWAGVLGQTDLNVYEPAYFNPEPGWVDVPAAMRIMFDRALRNGVVKYEVEEVIGFELDDDKGTVKGVRCKNGNFYKANKVLLATGAWTSRLMAPLEDELGLPDDQRVESQVSAYAVCVAQFRLSPDEAELYGKAPIAIFGDRVDLIPPTKDGILKFNTLRYLNTSITGSGRKITGPTDRDQSEIPDDIKEIALVDIRKVAPQLLRDGRSVDIWRACWDCGPPDRNMLICRHPHSKLSNLYLAIGGSSHSWKFLPIIGKYVANVVNGMGNGEEKDERWKWRARVATAS